MDTIVRTAVLAVALFSGGCLVLPPVEYQQAAAVPVIIRMEDSGSDQPQPQPRSQPQLQQAAAQDPMQAIMGEVVVMVAQEILSRL